MGRTLAACIVSGAALVAAVGCSGQSSSSSSSSSHSGTESLAIEGWVELAPATSSASPQNLAVDPDLGLVYVAGNMGATGMTSVLRVDVSNAAQMAITPFAPGFGGGIAVDPATHLVATTDGYGPGASGAICTLGIFEPWGTTLDAVTVTGCGASIANAGVGRFAVSTQCVDSFAIYDLAARAIVFETPARGVGANAYAGATPGAWYQNRTPMNNNGNRDRSLVLAPDGTTVGALIEGDFPFDGDILATDPSNGRIWFGDNQGELSQRAPSIFILDANFAPVVATNVTFSAVVVSVSPTIHRVFVATDSKLILVFDDKTGAVVGSIDFGAATGGFSPWGGQIVADRDRLYVLAYKQASGPRLFALHWRRS